MIFLRYFWIVLRYLWLTLRHKWYVCLAGWPLRVPILRLLLHDWGKCLPREFVAYAQQLCGRGADPMILLHAWLHHQNSHDHHWEYWISRSGGRIGAALCDPDTPIEMPAVCVREMLADWMAANITYRGCWPDLDHWDWLETHRSQMRLHPATWRLIDTILDDLGASS